MKVRIKTAPQLYTYQSGGTTITGSQQDIGSSTGRLLKEPGKRTDENRVRVMYPEVPSEKANVEVEQGEVVIAPDMSAIYKAGGKKHYEGGTKIKAQEGAYIVSDYIKTNPVVLQAIGFDPKADNKKTWASLLQSKVDPQYYNSLAGIISDRDKGKDVDRYAYNTAKLKMPELQAIVSKVALGNELSKAMQGKPYEIPQVAMGALQGLQQAGQQTSDHPMLEAKRGGLIKMQNGNQFQPWKGDQFDNKKNASVYSADDIFQKASMLGYKGPYNNLALQRWMLQNPNIRPLVDQLHKEHGMPKAGIADDGKWGYRWDMVLNKALESRPVTTKPVAEVPSKKGFVFMRPEMQEDQIAFDNRAQDVNLSPNAFDQLALLNAVSNPVNTYYPWAARPQAAYIQPQFDEPNYYPIQSIQRQRMDMLNQVSNPAIARAVGSYQPDQISGILQETQRARGNNMQSAANTQAFNAQVFNNLSGQNAQIDTSLYDKTNMSREQRDIARKLKAQDIQNTAHNMINNMVQMKYLMAMNPQFTVSGPFWDRVGFNGNGRSSYSASDASGANAPLSREQFLAKYPGYAALDNDPAQAYKIDEALREERDRREGLLFKSNKNFVANMYNPYMAQMTGMGSGYPSAGY